MTLGRTVARAAATVTCALVAWMVCVPARAEVRIGWDCFLPGGEPGCQDVATAFFPSVPGIERAATGDGDLTIALRSVDLPSARRYFAEFRGTPAGQGDAVHYTLSERLPHSTGTDRTTLTLVALLQRGAVPFLHVDAPGESSDGALSIRAAASRSRTETNEGDAREGLYVRPSIGGEIFSGGVRVIAAQGELETSYSSRDWRWLLSANGRYRHFTLELPDQTLEGGFFDARAENTLARSLGHGFSVAFLANARHEPQNNLAQRLRGGVGLEWVHASFLEADESNFGARYELYGAWDRYAVATVHGQRERLYPRQSLGLFARWHLESVDLDANVGGGVVSDQPDLWDVGAELSATFRLTDSLELGLSGHALYRGGAVHEPADPSQIDPIASIVAGNDFGELTYGSTISLAYAFGNGLLRSQDQRWR